MDLEISPLAPKSFPKMPFVNGVRMATANTETKYKGRPDLLLIDLVSGTSVAGVLTKSIAPGHPVIWCRDILPKGKARGLVVNAGNANVFNGKSGMQAVEAIAKSVGTLFHCTKNEVYVASTGVIGEKLDPSKIVEKIATLDDDLENQNWKDAAIAITTTDTFPKGSHRVVKVGKTTVNLVGIAKGSGMIAPDMATMLGFIFTDAAISKDSLQSMLVETANKSFNAITVDSDTSTSDTVLAFATGQAGNDPNADIAGFKDAFQDVLLDLAHQIVRDGEGATKFVEITVSGAESDQAAKTIGLAIANSPLVKTAIAGEDANWGRVVMAVGKSGEAADRDKLAISIGGIEIAKKGSVIPGYDEAPVAQHMKGQDILIDVDVGVGGGQATVWTCDLTKEYVAINGDYRS